jgi:tetratricopeptide (TPR) repeat protein
MFRKYDFDGIIRIAEALPTHDTRLANPKILAVLGRAYSENGNNCREEARECFRQASALGSRDPVMMRAWYYLEDRSGYGLDEAKRLCELMINADKVGPRYRSEFLSKLAMCYFKEANSLASVSSEKAIPLYRQSIETYLEAAWIGQSVDGMDPSETLVWLERPVTQLVRYLKEDVSPYLAIIEKLPAKKHDVSIDAAKILLSALPKAYLPDDPQRRDRLSGLFRKTAVQLDRFIKDSDEYPGLSYLKDTSLTFCEALSRKP